MNLHRVLLLAVIFPACLLACGATEDVSEDVAVGASAPGTAGADVACPTTGEVMDVAKVYIEHNATDADTGIHGLIGGAPWRSICINAPNGENLWAIKPSDRLGELGVSDFFWESNEPPNDEYSVDDLFADFPQGTYLVAGTGIDGIDSVAEAVFTHSIPAEPLIDEPLVVADPDEQDPPIIDRTGLVISWEPVSETIDGQPIEITGYQVIVTEEEAQDPNGWARPVYDVHVDPTTTTLSVPDEFVKADTLYELEVLAIEPSGNQTIAVGFFRTN